jgi:A/G-specific adenine glycosylase
LKHSPRRAEALLDWYSRVARDLPWRRTRDPYALLVSEVMLQQTQVARVVPRYEAWLARFPSVYDLASAPVADVLKEWSGLGYNRRALALQAAGRVVVADGWPGDAAGLRALPGVGPYTAAAVASFAWDEPVAAVDTNVRRVVGRWDGLERGPRDVSERAAELLPPGRAAAWNQAVMELGATVCRARAPRCGVCPVAVGCATRARGGPAPSARSASSRPRFEDTDRWARGRVVAALTGGADPPELAPERRARVLAGLERDGLVVLKNGMPELPVS